MASRGVVLSLVMVIVFSCALVVRGAVITVPDDYLSIQDAVYAAKTGDKVHIRAGVYYETSISIGRIGSQLSPRVSITIYGDGPGKTIIDGSRGSYDLFVVNAPYTIIRDMTLQNSKQSGVCFFGKGGLSLVLNTECKNNRAGISSIITSYDDRLGQDVASPVIVGNRLVDNRYYGLYLENGCQALVMHNWIEGNGYAGVYCRMDPGLKTCEPLVRNNFILAGDVTGQSYGVVIAGGAEPTFRNNIISGFETGALWYETDGVSGFRNNILTRCQTAIYKEMSSASQIDYCLFWENGTDIMGLASGRHNIYADPLFVDADSYDFHLLPDSPCIDAGYAVLPDGTTETDYDGSQVDIGVYGGKEVGPVCKILLSEPSKEKDGISYYYVGEPFEDYNGNGKRDIGEPFEDYNGNGKWDSDEPFTDENHNGKWDRGEPYTDENGNGHYDKGEPFEDLNSNGRWDDEREPFADMNKNAEYDDGALFTFIGLYTCFGFSIDYTDLYLAFLLDTGELYTFDQNGHCSQQITPLWPEANVGSEFAYAFNAITLKFLYGFPLIDHSIGLYAAMGPASQIWEPWDALTGETIALTFPQ